MKQLKIVTIAPTLLCDYKPRHIRALCGGKHIQCAIAVILYYCSVFCFCSSGKAKNVHLLFAELLQHKTLLHNFGTVLFPSKKARMYGTEIDLS